MKRDHHQQEDKGDIGGRIGEEEDHFSSSRKKSRERNNSSENSQFWKRKQTIWNGNAERRRHVPEMAE